jgi:putative transposase
VPDDLLFRKRYRIPSARYPGWDYRWAGAYSVTICTHGRLRCLGTIEDGEAVLSPVGTIVAEEWLKIPEDHPRATLDAWVVMPDHMHGILIFQGEPEDPFRRSKHPQSQSLGAVVGQFKGEATKRIRTHPGQSDFAWQPRFHDVILRTPADLERVRAYIRDNPRNWIP